MRQKADLYVAGNGKFFFHPLLFDHCLLHTHVFIGDQREISKCCDEIEILLAKRLAVLFVTQENQSANLIIQRHREYEMNFLRGTEDFDFPFRQNSRKERAPFVAKQCCRINVFNEGKIVRSKPESSHEPEVREGIDESNDGAA